MSWGRLVCIRYLEPRAASVASSLPWRYLQRLSFGHRPSRSPERGTASEFRTTRRSDLELRSSGCSAREETGTGPEPALLMSPDMSAGVDCPFSSDLLNPRFAWFAGHLRFGLHTSDTPNPRPCATFNLALARATPAISVPVVSGLCPWQKLVASASYLLVSVVVAPHHAWLLLSGHRVG